MDTVHAVHTATAEVALNVVRRWCPLLPDTPPMSLVNHVKVERMMSWWYHDFMHAMCTCVQGALAGKNTLPVLRVAYLHCVMELCTGTVWLCACVLVSCMFHWYVYFSLLSPSLPFFLSLPPSLPLPLPPSLPHSLPGERAQLLPDFHPAVMQSLERASGSSPQAASLEEALVACHLLMSTSDEGDMLTHSGKSLSICMSSFRIWILLAGTLPSQLWSLVDSDHLTSSKLLSAASQECEYFIQVVWIFWTLNFWL